MAFFLENGTDILFAFIIFVPLFTFVVRFFLFFERMPQRFSTDSFFFKRRREMRFISLVLVVITLGFYRVLVRFILRFLRSSGIAYLFLLFLMLVLFVFHVLLFFFNRNTEKADD